MIVATTVPAGDPERTATSAYLVDVSAIEDPITRRALAWNAPETVTFLARVTGQGSVGLGFPVRVGGRITGITLSPLSLAWLDQRVEAQLRRPIRDLLVIDDHGTVLAHAGGAAAVVGTNLGGTALVKKALHGDRRVGRTRFGGKRVRAAFDLVPLSDDAMHIAVTSGL